MIVDGNRIGKALAEAAAPSEARLETLLGRTREKKGLGVEEAAELLACGDSQKLFAAASAVKKEIYGSRIVLFAPLYLSSFCVNDCAYCGFHASNPAPRKKLSLEEIAAQTRVLEARGHKRLLLEAGEHSLNSIDYVVQAIETIYATRGPRGESIRRINV
ncbi:MAG: radical SAM protein, partial [Candidatus Micrarchaeota archaeon]